MTVGVAGVAANSGDTHALPSGFTVFGHTYHGSTGLLFAYGILIGAVGAAGLILLLAGIWTTSRRGVVARRELRHSRREMAAARKELAKPVPAATPARSVEPPPAAGGSTGQDGAETRIVETELVGQPLLGPSGRARSTRAGEEGTRRIAVRDKTIRHQIGLPSGKRGLPSAEDTACSPCSAWHYWMPAGYSPPRL
ncbi:LapA family protein [Nocardia tengchongensis]|uniref:LapA family protein n=1 Tax=Nocardia tengchongensis TaxID=2055889 RepID=A0ABX8CH83_9NOCA|nr:LapA family protein [Nocardia tengchongensis]QVI18914.1 LapA family protein [Nocardia tengchongensis]